MENKFQEKYPDLQKVNDFVFQNDWLLVREVVYEDGEFHKNYITPEGRGVLFCFDKNKILTRWECSE